MAEPITWRNVGGGGGGNPVALLALGQRQMQEGFNALSGLLQNEQNLQQRNITQAKENNTAAYLDAVQKADLADPAQRAALEDQRAQFGAAIDRNATRSAIDDRITKGQQRTIVANQFADQQTEREQRGLVDQGLQLAQAGDMEGVQKLLADTEFLDEGKVAQSLMGVLDARTRRQYAAEDQARQGRQETRQIAQFQESMAAATENRALRKISMANAQEERAFRNGSRVLDDAAEQAKGIMNYKLAGNEWANTSTDPAKDAQVLIKNAGGLDKFSSWLNSDRADFRQVQEGITDLLSNGVEVDGEKFKVPPAMLQQLLNSNSNRWNFTDNPIGDIRQDIINSLSDNEGAGNRAKARQATEIKASANNIMQTLNAAKTKLGSSSTLDTSGIVSALDELKRK